jgi:hypothetical protein
MMGGIDKSWNIVWKPLDSVGISPVIQRLLKDAPGSERFITDYPGRTGDDAYPLERKVRERVGS